MLSKAARYLAAVVLANGAHGAPAPLSLDRRSIAEPFAVLDPQIWVNPDDMTWDDFISPPGTDWSNPANTGSIRNFRIALVAVDYPDENFTITKPVGTTPFNNPQPDASELDREDVPAFYRDLLNKPQDINRNHTLHEYWMEDSAGQYGVDLTAFGAYRLPSKSFQYGVDEEGFNPGACPEEPCTADLRTDALGAWRADVGNATADSFELVFILSAGQDESGSWQEFGVMKFLTNEDVTDEFGPPGNSSLPNYAKTRYVEWTSWASASTIWPNAGGGSSTQAESSGAATYAHELSHLLGIGDNYNNPYGVPARRAYTGPWSMMSRGSFNGPGGPHTRWQIPSLQGATMGSLHTVRDKLQLGLTDKSNVLIVQKSDLESSGLVTAEVTARAVDNPDGLIGVRIVFGTDLSPYCNVSTTPLCDGGGYNSYDLEIVDRMGADSFTPDSGVMISKSKDSDRSQPFQWTIDANPQDINIVDYIRPDGKEEKVTIGDYRQLADALFHAGTRSGSQYEHIDEANGVHLYVVERRRDDLGVLHYTVGARALASSNAGASGVGLSPGAVVGPGSPSATHGAACVFDLTNTGKQILGGNATLGRYTRSDVYRLEAVVDASGWRVELPNALAVAEFGATTQVVVAIAAAESADADAVIRLTATSESDRSVSSSAICAVSK